MLQSSHCSTILLSFRRYQTVSLYTIQLIRKQNTFWIILRHITFVVETMGYFMPDDHPDAAVVKGFGKILAIK